MTTPAMQDGLVQLSFAHELAIENGRIASEEEVLLVEQVTLHNLEFTRELLRRKGLPSSGVRETLREHCIAHLQAGTLSAAELSALLTSLEMWGNQRVRLVRFSDRDLGALQDRAAVVDRASEAGLGDLIDKELPLAIDDEVAPLSIRFYEQDGRRLLILIAGKVRQIWVHQPDLPDREDVDNPEITYRPFKRETQKVISFAEIDVDSGEGLISTKLLRTGTSYTAEFVEFYNCFEPFLRLVEGMTVDLYRAARNVYDSLSLAEVRIRNQRSLSPSGGKASFTSHSHSTDVRADTYLNQARQTLGASAPGDYCNFNWLRNDDLYEDIHVHLHGTLGEVSILGQVREDSVRYVLQHIRQANQ